MCILCNQGRPQNHFGSRRRFLKGAAATGAAVAGLNLFAPRRGRGRTTGTRPQDSGRTGPALRHPRRRGDVDGPAGRRLRPGRRAGRRQEDPRRRPEPARRRRRRDRRARPHRHAGLHRHAPSPVRDGAAQLPRRRRADQRRFGLSEREPHLLRVSFCRSSRRCTGRRTSTSTSCSADCPSSTTASRRCTTSRRSITRRSTPTPRSRRCSTPGRRAAFGYFESAGANPAQLCYPQDAVRIKKQWFSSSDQLVTMIMGGEVYLGPDVYRAVLDDRAPARPADRGAHPLAVRHPSDPGRARPGHGGSDQHRTLGIGPDNLFIHMTGMSRHRLAEGQGRRRAGLDRLPDRDEHAARHAADPQDAEPAAWSRR